LENKPGAIAVHWRGLPIQDRERIEDTVQRYSSAIHEYGLKLLPFDGGLEVRGGAKNKGDAVHTVLSESVKGVAAAYLGDDQTDEDAFRAIKGYGLGVLVRTEPRPTSADVWLRPPDELGQFLRDWLAVCGAGK
jgi:trehalose-phosphatase